MNLRLRLIIVVTVAVAVSLALASTIGYFTVRRQMFAQVDDHLRTAVDRILTQQQQRVAPFDFEDVQPAAPFWNETQVVQFVSADGEVLSLAGASRIPVTVFDQQVAAGIRAIEMRDVMVGGHHMRAITVAVADGMALQVAQSLRDVTRTLSSYRVDLLLIGLGGVVFAVLLGVFAARAALRPVQRLSRAVAHVTATQDLSSKIEVNGDDEIGRLAFSFNAMLDALDGARRQQQQLVADASHELRTPLTSVRTNIEVLQVQSSMSEVERTRLLTDVTEQLSEMGDLVSDLVELAREDVPPRPDELSDVRLDELVSQAVERAQLHAPGVRFEVGPLGADIVSGDRRLMQRAVANLLDNASKWSPPGGVVSVEQRDGVIVIRDSGPGIAPDDLPYVFDRFYRSPAARSMPGSGLGLAIVRRVAEIHRGSVWAEPAPGGGTIMRLHFPCVALPEVIVVPDSPDSPPESERDTPPESPGTPTAIGV